MSALLALIRRRSLNNAEDSCMQKKVYNKLTQEEANQLIRFIKKRLSNIVNKHTIRGNCSKKESEFLLSNLNKFNIPHFYISWKNFEEFNCRQTNCGWVQLDTYSSFDICWTLPQEIQ